MKCGAVSVLGLAGVRALEGVPFDHHQLMGAGISDRSTNKGPSVIGTYGVDRERCRPQGLTAHVSARLHYHAEVNIELELLVHNLTTSPAASTLVSQYLPLEYQAIREGILASSPNEMVQTSYPVSAAQIRGALRRDRLEVSSCLKAPAAK